MAAPPNNTRRRMGIIFVLILALALGRIFKNVTFGLVVGLLLGVLAGGLKRH